MLTVAGLVALGEVLPKVRRLAPRLPERFRDPFRATLPDQGVLGGERGALGRHRRTFVTEQRALLDELPDVVAALGRVRGADGGGGGGWDVVVRPSAGRTLAAAVEGAELVEIARAGHFVARDAPGAARRGRRPLRPRGRRRSVTEVGGGSGSKGTPGASASNTAVNLRSVSRRSTSGREPATIPTPADSVAVAPTTVIARIPTTQRPSPAPSTSPPARRRARAALLEPGDQVEGGGPGHPADRRGRVEQGHQGEHRAPAVAGAGAGCPRWWCRGG